MEKLLHVSSSPHVRSKAKTSTIMLLVIIALWPAACFGVWLNGPYAAAVLGVSIGAAVLTEYIYERLMKRPVTVGDGSAVVTGLLLGDVYKRQQVDHVQRLLYGTRAGTGS